MDKKGELFKIILIVTIFFLTIQMIYANSSLSSETSLKKWEDNLSNTNKKILQENIQKYEPRILDEFAKLKYSETNQTNVTKKTEVNKSFIRVVFYLKNISQTKNVLSTFSSNEIKDIINRNISNRISVQMTQEAFFKLIQDNRIDKIYFSRKGYFLLAESAPLIKANDAWSSGYTGDGVKICVIDSGVDKYHSFLNGKIVAEKCYCSDNCCPGGFSESNNASDDYGHGTHVVGIIASQNSTYKGIAPNVSIYMVKVGGALGGPDIDLDVGDAIDWCVNQGVRVISISIGDDEDHPGDSDCPEGIKNSIDNAFYHNISVVVASGNNGYNNGINYPACSPNATSVGSVYDDNVGLKIWGTAYFPWTCIDWTTSADKLVCNSNRGADLNLLAPGSVITSTKMGGGFEDRSGTSMATPMVSGAAALLLEKKPTLTPSEIKNVLQDNGISVGSWKRIDVQAALDSFCICGNWSYGSCGGSGEECGSNRILRTRSCSPSECNTTSECVNDASCEEETPPETGNCSEAGYEFCIKSEVGDCNVSIVSNLYLNVNNIKWGAVEDIWNPYVINNYTIGWKNKDAKKMYYNCSGDTNCQYGGCNCSQIDSESTMITITAPGTAHHEGILGYDDTGSNFCWVGWSPFDPNYNDNLIYVLTCFSDSDCPTNQHCNKSGSWDSWSCTNKKSDGQSCNSASECSSGYCDNDSVGLSDDDWCFTPYNTYFDGQETSYCEYSINNGVISDCDERQVGANLNKCIGIPFYGEECSNTCQYQDITSVFDCSESGCSCSQPLCDGLVSGSNITSCSSGETYFSDNCTSAAEGQDRDNICRSSSFASGCTADSECDGIIAGTGDCSATCVFVPNDTSKFYIKDSTGNIVAWIGNFGNIVLKGSCFSGGSCNNLGSNSFIIKNASNTNVAFINSTGDLCIVKGDCSDESASCNPTTKAFIMKNSSGYNMSYIDIDGELCLTGRLYENSTYV